MALREYEWNGSTWQFEEGAEPEGARPVEAAKAEPKPARKRRVPANKARKASDKGA